MNVDLKVADLTTTYTDLFDRNKDEIFSLSPDFINEIRREALLNHSDSWVSRNGNLKIINIPGLKIYSIRRYDLITEPGKAEC